MNLSSMISTSVLKGKAIYGDLLLKEGYKRYQVDALAISEFLSYERERIGEPAELYLLAIKKILLYAIPIIAPYNVANKRGVALTAQFTTDCIINDLTKTQKRLAIGDKYTLLGFAFPPQLINNLDYSTFEWKYYQQYPNEYIFSALDIEHLDGIESVQLSSKYSKATDKSSFMAYLIKPSHYEDLDLYNQILHALKLQLDEYTNAWTSIVDQVDSTTHIAVEAPPVIERIKPYNESDIIPKLNSILEKQIDPTYTISYYETLQATANWLLYNQIWLYGYDSPVVSSYLARLDYTRSENHKVFIRLALEAQQKLLQTRAEKIAREQYPFYFSPNDRRGIFSKFNRFNIDKLAKAHQNEIKILLEKELAHQNALINNKCPHIPILKTLLASESVISDIIRAYNDVHPFIDIDRKDDESHTYYCKNCSYALLCEHEMEFYSELKLSKESQSINDGADNDLIYTTQQIIVNRYKQTQVSIDRSDIFAYHCKYCSKDIGKSDDIIQVAPKDFQRGSHTVSITQDQYKIWAHASLSSILTMHVDPLVLGIDKKKVIQSILSTVRNHLEEISYPFKKMADENDIEAHTKLSALVLSLCAMISLNINVLKTGRQLLIDFKPKTIVKSKTIKQTEESPIDDSSDATTDESSDEEAAPAVIGGSIKTEFASAFSIIKNSSAIKLVVISDDKIRAMLLDYYRRIAKDIGDVIDVNAITRTNEDKLSTEITQSPVYAYLQYIVARNNGTVIKKLPFKQIMGLDITKGITGNLYAKIPSDTIKSSDARARYIHESYAIMHKFLSEGKYLGADIEPELPQSIQSYETDQRKRIYKLMHNPKYYFDERNAREVSFHLENLNLIYCNGMSSITKHLWVKGICKHCGIAIAKTSQTHNQSISKLIDSEIAKDALFDYYTNNCPVKDIHVYPDEPIGLDSKCAQCGVTKRQIINQDPSYYNQHLVQFTAYRKGQLEALTAKVNILTQIEGLSAADHKVKVSETTNPAELDAKNDQMIVSLSKIFEISAADIQSLSPIFLDSYIRLVYERYAYASNTSYDMYKHPDIEFYDFIKDKFFNGTKPIKLSLDPLTSYSDRQASVKLKVNHLLSLLMAIANSDSSPVVELGRFLIKKIIAQEARRRDFNFAKLKSITIIAEDTEMDSLDTIDEDEEDEGEDSMFMAYDIDMDDMEDNLNGEHD